MANKMQYVTQQRKDLLEYFQTMEGQHVTAADVVDCFHRNGKKIGITTVYRQLEKMVDEGIVRKYIIDANSPACFEYVGEDDVCQDPVCFHCKCEKCGKLIHLHCDELKGIAEHLQKHHRFALNAMRTVFYGVCEDCMAADGEAGE